MKIFLSLFLLLLSMNIIFAQATIKGKIVDNKTGETLIGANVVLQGTTIGAIAYINGNYVIKDIKPGVYRLVCSFISYERFVSEEIRIKEKEVVNYNFKMKSLTVQIKGATISARAVKNTENALVSMQIKSATSVNGISSREISMNGDKTAAASLRRVSGVTVQDGKYIYVRGLGDRYSRTDLNGAMVPSLDPEKNNIQLDLFPSAIIENMMVYKTFSPQLPANFAGGYVNIQTKKFPEEFLVQFSTSFGYNSNATFNRSYKTYKGGKTDFLGFDDGTRAIPELAQGEIPFRYQNDLKLDAITSSFNKTMEASTKVAPVNHDFSIAIGDKKKLFKKEFGYLMSYTYTHDYRYYENGENGQYSLTSANSELLQKDLKYIDSRGIDYVLWGFMASASLKLNDNSSITLNLIRNQGGISSSRYQGGWNDYHEVNIQTRTLTYAQREFSAAQLLGEHIIKNLGDLLVNWQMAYSLSKQDEPDLRFFTNIYEINKFEDTIYTIDPAKQGVPARYWRFMNENNYDGKLDFSLPYKLAGRKAKLQFGGKLMYKNRTFTERRFDVNDNNDSYHGDVADYLCDDNIGMAISDYPQKYGIYISDASQLSNTYNANQHLFAAYLMTDQRILLKLRAVYGVRIETTDIYLQNANPDNSTGALQGIDVLPAFNFTYNPIKKINLRAAYTRTLARPSFRELAPYASFEFAGDYTLIGNENLERTLIDNVDIRFEMALKPGELLSFDLFYKGFINPIERTFVATAGNDELTFENADKANVYGMEFEIRKNLDFIDVLKNFKLGFNIAVVNSIVSVSSDEMDVIRATDPTAAATRSMYGQAPYVVNSYLNYILKNANIIARIVYNVTGPKLAIVIKGGTPNVYEAPRHTLDFVFKKSFGPKISLTFKAKNMLNSAFKKYYSYNNEKYIYSNFNLGRSFSLGFAYKI